MSRRFWSVVSGHIHH